jgi:hypothetical protein
VTQAHERIFAQFADRSQVDLVLFPASVPGGSVPNVVVLYDPDERLMIAAERKPVTPGQIREWAFGGWCALADLGKYLRRGSTWEALARLNEARAQLWQLWAVTLGVPDPQYGLTSILDFAPGQVPASFEGTVADLDPGRWLVTSPRTSRSCGKGPFAEFMSQPYRLKRVDAASAPYRRDHGAFRLRWVRMTP